MSASSLNSSSGTTGQRETGTWGEIGAGAGAAAGAGGAGGRGAGVGAAAVVGGAGARRGGAEAGAGGPSRAVTLGAGAGARGAGAGAENKVCQLPSQEHESQRILSFKCNTNPLELESSSTLLILLWYFSVPLGNCPICDTSNPCCLLDHPIFHKKLKFPNKLPSKWFLG